MAQNKIALSKILHYAHHRTLEEIETMDKDKIDKIVDEDFDLLDVGINGIYWIQSYIILINREFFSM